MIGSFFLALAVMLAPVAALGASHVEGDMELASAHEAAKISEAIARVGCKASEIEKESDDLFEIDDAECEIGQYDFKLNGAYKITVMTSDE
ncbi:MAG: hypothetical protein H7Y08_11605 [Rhizobiaceae bacterium]|nr:hypothetical protein [Rhizobiaceae bacterium]